jgi:hypothetical protein
VSGTQPPAAASPTPASAGTAASLRAHGYALAADVLTIDTATEESDPSSTSTSMPAAQFERLSNQRDIMISAMVGVFKWLNGGVFVFVALAWLVGIDHADYRIVDRQTLMALIGATVVQAGIAFVAITRFLFPSPTEHHGSGKG